MSTENATILAVDDERELVEIYRTWFDGTYAVRAAYGGREALSAFDESIDLVLLDRRMPGTSGDDVLDALREDGHDVPVVMVTAVEPDEGIIELPFDEYVIKPVDRTKLLEAVDRALTRAEDDTASDVLDALGDEKTRRCCRVLNGDEKSAREIADVTGYSLPTVYRRLNTLRQAGLIDSRTTIDPGGDHYEAFTTITERITVELGEFTVQCEPVSKQEI
ncbi:winged helix-turn-helix domain-containing protein [Natronomonas salsuginis]|jgi:CheY-like chemotaxis protein|uniref:Response regulator n=1 Tax=Natronomonas salsuginis TaxID=2217661 RepID=A0A4U5J9U8_9EURY|nr:winged helix-turn-helix domain-containing protein [Natronomonas salsuginis]TKR24946.1 response regulator [Natronomonas salsuginis]